MGAGSNGWRLQKCPRSSGGAGADGLPPVGLGMQVLKPLRCGDQRQPSQPFVLLVTSPGAVRGHQP